MGGVQRRRMSSSSTRSVARGMVRLGLGWRCTCVKGGRRHLGFLFMGRTAWEASQPRRGEGGLGGGRVHRHDGRRKLCLTSGATPSVTAREGERGWLRGLACWATAWLGRPTTAGPKPRERGKRAGAGLLGPDSRESRKNPFSFSKLVFQTNFEYKFKSI